VTRTKDGLTGTATVTGFIVRRDRVRIVVWVAAIAVLVALLAASVKGLFPTQADLDQAAAATNGNAAVIAFNGPAQGLDSVGGEVAFQAGAMGLVVVALMSVMMIAVSCPPLNGPQPLHDGDRVRIGDSEFSYFQ